MNEEKHSGIKWMDLLWLVFLLGLAVLPPVQERHKQLALLAMALGAGVTLAFTQREFSQSPARAQVLGTPGEHAWGGAASASNAFVRSIASVRTPSNRSPTRAKRCSRRFSSACSTPCNWPGSCAPGTSPLCMCLPSTMKRSQGRQ